MDRMEIIMQAINALIPDARYIIRENFDGVEWLDDRTMPTESEVQTKYDEIIAAEPTNLLREVRNVKLAETDWEIVMHKEKGTNIPTALKTYRQSLRDITDTYTSLDDVVWPEKP
jgi:hypothetical protein